MILPFLLVAASAASTGAIEAERAYAAMAQTRGQWTAFRATAAPEAMMFVPEPARAGPWLNGRADPPVAVMWWPARGWMSCDGKLAVNFGPWVRKGGKATGTFTTVWTKQADGRWQWLLDRGNATPSAVAASEPVPVSRASCRGLAAARAAAPGRADGDMLVAIGDSMPVAAAPDFTGQDGDLIAGGAAPDASLKWEVRALKGRAAEAHVLRVWRWDGTEQRLALIEATDPAH